jgi:hypothetical protein
MRAALCAAPVRWNRGPVPYYDGVTKYWKLLIGSTVPASYRVYLADGARAVITDAMAIIRAGFEQLGPEALDD